MKPSERITKFIDKTNNPHELISGVFERIGNELDRLHERLEKLEAWESILEEETTPEKMIEALEELKEEDK